jgi:hypothetical protein
MLLSAESVARVVLLALAVMALTLRSEMALVDWQQPQVQVAQADIPSSRMALVAQLPQVQPVQVVTSAYSTVLAV